MLHIFRCIQSNNQSQGFYDNLACTKLDANGIPLRPYQILRGVYPLTCPVGSTKLYPLFGLKSHGGVDRGSYYREPGYFDTEYPDVTWRQFIEIDSSGGLGVDVVSDREVLPCTEGCPDGTKHFIKRRYWHNISAIVKGEEWNYARCRDYIGARERALVAENVKIGDKIFLSDSTGVSSGHHVHDCLKWSTADGDGIHTNNGYFGAFDFAPFYENRFVIDVVRERRLAEEKAEEVARLEAQIKASQLTLIQILTKFVFLLQQQIQNLAKGLGGFLKGR